MTMVVVAIETEWAKFWRATVVQLTTAALVVGVAVMCLSFQVAVLDPDSAMATKLGPVVAAGGWTGLIAGANQITATGGVLGFGVVLSWLFGREFTQGTIVGLFAIPVPRSTTALAKTIVYLAWSVGTSLALGAVMVGVGSALSFGPVAWNLIAKLVAVTALSALVAAPAALVATMSRGYIGAIGSLVGIIVLAQVGVATGAGGWLPIAAPGLWAAGFTTEYTAIQLLLVGAYAAVFIALTTRQWERLQLT
jgi:ABC-2 type transport system permease protein